MTYEDKASYDSTLQDGVFNKFLFVCHSKSRVCPYIWNGYK